MCIYSDTSAFLFHFYFDGDLKVLAFQNDNFELKAAESRMCCVKTHIKKYNEHNHNVWFIPRIEFRTVHCKEGSLLYIGTILYFAVFRQSNALFLIQTIFSTKTSNSPQNQIRIFLFKNTRNIVTRLPTIKFQFKNSTQENKIQVQFCVHHFIWDFFSPLCYRL